MWIPLFIWTLLLVDLARSMIQHVRILLGILPQDKTKCDISLKWTIIEFYMYLQSPVFLWSMLQPNLSPDPANKSKNKENTETLHYKQ